MAILSVLRAAGQGLKTLKWPILRQNQPSIKLANVSLGAPARQITMGPGGIGRTMKVLPSQHEAKIFKDHVHYYVLLGAIPVGLVIFFTNVFIGKATLSEIPDDYEPKHWEYYRHPIERWFSRYIYDTMETTYEMHMHKLYIENEKRKMRLLEKKVKNLMNERGDYKGWYYIPITDRGVWVDKKNTEDMLDGQSFGPVR